MSEENKVGVLRNIIGVIMSPIKTMEKVNENPKVWQYLIPVTLIQLIITLLQLPKLTSYTILKAQEMPNFSQAAIPIMKTGIAISTIVWSIVGPGILILISTALIKLVCTISKKTGNFKNLYCMNTLAYVPILISAILTTIIMFFTEPQNIKNISTSLTVVLSSSTDITSGIYKVFSCIDFFYIWSSILLAIGTSVVFKMKMKKSATIVFGIYIVVAIIRVLV